MRGAVQREPTKSQAVLAIILLQVSSDDEEFFVAIYFRGSDR